MDVGGILAKELYEILHGIHFLSYFKELVYLKMVNNPKCPTVEKSTLIILIVAES